MEPGIYNYKTHELLIDEKGLKSFINNDFFIINKAPLPEGIDYSDGIILSIPEGIKIIGNVSFGKDGLGIRDVCKEVYIPSTANYIDHHTFEEVKLKAVHFEEPKHQLCVGASAFAHTDVENLTIPMKVELYSAAFAHCENLRFLDYKSDETINSEVFAVCSKLEEVRCNAGKIISRAFYNCPNLIKFIATDNLWCIESLAFSDCTKLVLDINNAYFTSVDGAVYTKDMETLITCSAKESLKVPKMVKRLIPLSIQKEVKDIIFCSNDLSEYDSLTLRAFRNRNFLVLNKKCKEELESKGIPEDAIDIATPQEIISSFDYTNEELSKIFTLDELLKEQLSMNEINDIIKICQSEER